MRSGKVLKLYMSTPDMMRSGHRQLVDDFECDEGGIIGDLNHDNAPEDKMMLLTCQKSYDLIEEADLFIDQGALLENIHVDVDLYDLKPGSVIEIGEVFFEVTAPCEAYGYLYGFDPDIPDIIKGNRGLFIRPVDFGHVAIGDEVNVVKEG
jgi:MOSC domain-containing protein YiiM